MQKNYDVIIIGLGTAGSVTAIKCAELGLSVLGVDRLSQMGGTGTSGGVCGYYFGSNGGYFEKINELSNEIQNEYFIDAPYSLSPAKAIALERDALKKGVEISYNTHVLSVEKENDKVFAATFIKEGKKFTASAKLFIDTSGNGDFSKLCGCEFLGGRDSDNTYMTYTNPVFIANPTPRMINRDSGVIDMSDNTAYSKELLRSNSCYPVFSEANGHKCTYLKTASLPGVRESRRVLCERTLEFEDAIYQNPCVDPLLYAFSNADTHEKCIALEPDIAKRWYAISNLWGVCMSVPVPMKSIIPKGVKGLLCGGRMLGVSHTLSSVVRMKKDMEKLGEAMAYISYLAVSKNVDVREISYSDLKPYLLKSGVLDENNNVGFVNRTKEGLVPFEFPKTLEELSNDLETDRESFAIFAAKNIENSTSLLVQFLDLNNRKSKNAALALGLMGEKVSLPYIRNLAENKDITIPKTGLKMTIPIGVSAICLLGLMKDKQSIPILKKIIEDNGSFDTEKFVSTEMFGEIKDLQFQFVTHSIAALKNIAKDDAKIEKEIHEFFENVFKTNDLPLVINTKSSYLVPLTYNYTEIIKNFALS